MLGPFIQELVEFHLSVYATLISCKILLGILHHPPLQKRLFLIWTLGKNISRLYWKIQNRIQNFLLFEIKFRECSGNIGEHPDEILIRTFFGVPLTDKALTGDSSSEIFGREKSRVLVSTDNHSFHFTALTTLHQRCQEAEKSVIWYLSEAGRENTDWVLCCWRATDKII